MRIFISKELFVNHGSELNCTRTIERVRRQEGYKERCGARRGGTSVGNLGKGHPERKQENKVVRWERGERGRDGQ